MTDQLNNKQFLGSSNLKEEKRSQTEDELYFNCLIEMVEGLEKQMKFSNDVEQMKQLFMHKGVVMKLIEQSTFIPA